MIRSEDMPDSLSWLVEQLADEMASAWHAGQRPLTEHLLHRLPQSERTAPIILDLLAEELALRQEYAEPRHLAAFVARFPDLAGQIRALMECQRVLGARSLPPDFPNLADDLGEFHLLSELGRGAAGRVYLATQSRLANRPVVLKLTPDRGHEHLSLARLQHTNIVPLYSAHEFPERGLRVLCLPYFGGATLADIWRPSAEEPDPCQHGADIVSRLRQIQKRTVIVTPVRGAACDFLSGSPLVDAVCWIGVCLADALQYAHDRGLLHLDLKPSNVLIAADGIPMLLDFHLAREPLRTGDPAPSWLGGTPGLMPPEQVAALQAVRAGSILTVAVDERADVFAMGMLLATMLRSSLGDAYSTIPLGVRDILARCTAIQVSDRYATASDLAVDLRRHLADRPLRGVQNRSLVERWHKWRRRQPHAIAMGLACLALAAGASGWGIHVQRQAARGWDLLRDGESHLANHRYSEAVESFRGGEALVSGVPFQRRLSAQLHAGRQSAERGQIVTNLHQLVERVRPIYGAEVVTPDQLTTALRSCRDIWQLRQIIAEALPTTPESGVQISRSDLLDLGILTAHLMLRAAPPGHDVPARESALAVLNEAESLLGSSRVLHLERAILARQMERIPPPSGGVPTPAPSAWEHWVLGRAYLASGDVRQAVRELDLALDLDPASLWANFERGRCSLKLGEAQDAVASFTACLALEPRQAWCWYNRGLAMAEAGRHQQAWADFDRALDRDATLSTALLARALAKARCGQAGDGFQDLQLAAERGVPSADVAYHRALIQVHLDDTTAAIASLRAGLIASPQHRLSRELLAKLQPEQNR